MFELSVLVVLVLALGPLAYLAVMPRLEDAPVQLAEAPGGRVEYLQDREGTLTLAEVAQAAAGRGFHPLADAAKDVSLLRVPGPRVNWLQLTIPNDKREPAQVVLQFSDFNIDEAEVFLATSEPVAAPTVPLARTGLRVPPAERKLRSHLPAFAVTLPPQRTTVLYVRSPSDSDPPPGSIALWSSIDDFRRHEQRQVLPIAIYIGICGALLLFHALATAVLRERFMPLFLLYVGTTVVLVLFASNVSAWLLPGPAGVPRKATVLGLLGLACFVRVQFSRTFLDVSAVAPPIDTFLRITASIVGVATLIAPALLLAPEVLPLAARIVSAAAFFTVLVLPVAATSAGWRGIRQAPLAAVAFTCTAAGLAWIILGRFGFVPDDRTDGVPLLIGAGLEILLLGVAIAHRQQLSRDDQEQLHAIQMSHLVRDAADANGDVLSLTHQLAQSKQDKNRLISMIAQDVRAPLGSLVAVSRSLPPERAAEQLPLIRRRCSALIELVNNLLDWARLRTGQFPHEPETFNLAALADTAIRPLEGSASDKGVRLERSIPPNLAIRVDRPAMQSVLRNLVGNALKFTAPGGTVTVDARYVAPSVELRVQDTGVGMTAEQLARIQPSAMGAELPSTPGTAGETGAGVGLAVARDLLERDGGTLRFESSLGRGTIAIATLPAQIAPAPSAPAATPASRPVVAAVH